MRNQLVTDLRSNIFMLVPVTFFILKNPYLIAKPEGLAGFVQKIHFSKNDLEIWLKRRRYIDKLVRKQILKAKKFSRAELLNNQRKKNEDKLVLNITYHLSLARSKIIMTRIHFLLRPNNEHNKVFRDIPIMGFRRDKYLKYILVRAKIPQIKNKGCCGSCKEPRCEIYVHIIPTKSFLLQNHLLQNANMRLDQKI